MGKLLYFPSSGGGAQEILKAYQILDYPLLIDAWSNMQAEMAHLQTPGLDGEDGYSWPQRVMLARRLDGEDVDLALVRVRGRLRPEGRAAAAAAIDHLVQGTMGRDRPALLESARAGLLQRIHDQTSGYWFEIEFLKTGEGRDMEVRRPEPGLSLEVVEHQISVNGLSAASQYFLAIAEGAIQTMEGMADMLSTVPQLRD